MKTNIHAALFIIVLSFSATPSLADADDYRHGKKGDRLAVISMNVEVDAAEDSRDLWQAITQAMFVHTEEFFAQDFKLVPATDFIDKGDYREPLSIGTHEIEGCFVPIVDDLPLLTFTGDKGKMRNAEISENLPDLMYWDVGAKLYVVVWCGFSVGMADASVNIVSAPNPTGEGQLEVLHKVLTTEVTVGVYRKNGSTMYHGTKKKTERLGMKEADHRSLDAFAKADGGKAHLVENYLELLGKIID